MSKNSTGAGGTDKIIQGTGRGYQYSVVTPDGTHHPAAGLNSAIKTQAATGMVRGKGKVKIAAKRRCA